MIRLHDELVERFKKLYKAKYGVDLTSAEAEEKLKELAELVRATSLKREEKRDA